MKLCFLADARSPIAQNWIHYFIAAGHGVHVISSYPCASDVLPGALVQVVPVAFSRFVRAENLQRNDKGVAKQALSRWMRNSKTTALAYAVRYWFGPLDVYYQAITVRRLIAEIAPDLVHAMRLPFEGFLAAEALKGVPIPLLLSVWGNDLTLFAKRFPLIARMTRHTLRRADALHSDCQRDLRLAREWGFDSTKSVSMLPGGGGVQMNIFSPGAINSDLREKWSIYSRPVVFYPRRFRPGSVRIDTFFKAVPLVLRERPEVIFICVGMAGHPTAEIWKQKLQIFNAIRLLPTVSHEEMANLFRLADVTVSPSEHDGTPNTLLEAMACGSFPVVGDIESIREWICDGANGLLCDPARPESLAQAILRALSDDDLRHRAAVQNRALIAERAEYHKVMTRAEEFYRQIIS